MLRGLKIITQKHKDHRFCNYYVTNVSSRYVFLIIVYARSQYHSNILQEHTKISYTYYIVNLKFNMRVGVQKKISKMAEKNV